MFEPLTGKEWDTLSVQDKRAKLKILQQACLQKEREILRLIKLRNLMPNRKLPPGELDFAAKIFERQHEWTKKKGKEGEVSHRWIQKLIEDYELYRAEYTDDPSAEFFMPLPMGRPQGQLLTEDQKAIIRFALAERSRKVRSVFGKVRKLDVPFEILDIYSYAKSLCPLPSYDTTRRYIHRFQQENPALFKRITEGEDAVEEELLLKKRNDVSRPNQRWQSDARDLPWYVKHDGKVYRVCLIIIYDDYSGFIIWWRLVLKMEKKIDDVLVKANVNRKARRKIKRLTRTRSSSFTGEDVVLMLLTAMYRTGIRPEEIYTDNGSQYLLAERLMAALNVGDSSPIKWTHSRPGKPWGRGKVECALGKLTKLLGRIPGTYQKRNRMSIRAAMNHPDLYTYEEAVAELAEHFKFLNERPRKRAPSRFDMWRSVLSLRAPPIRQMALIEKVVSVQQEVTLDDWAINFHDQKWEPKVVEGQNRRIYRRLADAIARGEKAWLCSIKLDIGWKAEVCLDGEWIELVPKDTQQGNSQHNQDQAASLKDLREEYDKMLEADTQVAVRIAGALTVMAASSGEYAERPNQGPAQGTTSSEAPPEGKTTADANPDAAERPNQGPAQGTTSSEAPPEGKTTADANPDAKVVSPDNPSTNNALEGNTAGRGQGGTTTTRRQRTKGPHATEKPPSAVTDVDDLADLPDIDALISDIQAQIKREGQ